MHRTRERSVEEILAPVIFDEDGNPLRDKDGNAITTKTVMDAKEIKKPVTMEELIQNLRDVLSGECDPKSAAPRVAAARLMAELARMIRAGDNGPRTMIQVNVPTVESVKAKREGRR